MLKCPLQGQSRLWNILAGTPTRWLSAIIAFLPLTKRWSPSVTATIATMCKKLCPSTVLSFSGVFASISSRKVLYVSVTMVFSRHPNKHSCIIFNWLLASDLRKKLKKTGKQFAGTISTLTPIAAPAAAKVKCILFLCSYPEGRLLIICIGN